MTTRRYDLTLRHRGDWTAETTTELDLDDRPAVYRAMVAMVDRAHGRANPERYLDYTLEIHKQGSPYEEMTFVPTANDQDDD